MTDRTTRTLLIGVALWVAAAGAYGILRATYGQRPAWVHVRWAPSVDEGARREIERAHSLTRPEARDERTWGYFLTDLSTANIRSLVADPAVEDTHNIHRTAFRVWRTAPRGAYLSPRPAWIAALLELLIRASLVGGAVAIGLGAFHAWRLRRASTAKAAA